MIRRFFNNLEDRHRILISAGIAFGATYLANVAFDTHMPNSNETEFEVEIGRPYEGNTTPQTRAGLLRDPLVDYDSIALLEQEDN